jgi:hypothetical protein
MKWLALFLMITPAAAQTLQKPSSLPPTGNFVYIDQIGNYNTIFVEQTDSGQKQAAVLSNGDSNNYNVVQSGSGNHTAIIGPTNTSMNSNNSNNTLSIIQSGSSNNSASIQLQNSTSNNNNTASITQAGGVGADKQFTLQLQGSGIGATVVQDSPTTRDSSSMQIICNAPPCTGYSYIKH